MPLTVLTAVYYQHGIHFRGEDQSKGEKEQLSKMNLQDISVLFS